MTTPDTLRDLLKRVEAGERSSFALECEIEAALGLRRSPPPPYAADLTTADALVQKVLPGVGWSLTRPAADDRGYACSAELFESIRDVDQGYGEYAGTGATPPLALIAALLKALIAQAETA